MKKQPLAPMVALSLVQVLSLCAIVTAIPTSQPADKEPESVTASPCESLLESIDANTSASERLSARLAAADCVINQQASPVLSTLLSGREFDRVALGKSSALAIELVDKAAGDLDEAGLSDDDKYAQQDKLDRLHAFAEMFSALSRKPGDEDAAQRLTDASIGLAMYADDPDEKVVEAAKLWQAVAYRAAGKPDRALQVLRPVLAAPAARNIGLYARIERCRALADRGDHAAAIALALRLTSRVDAWFEGLDRDQRQRATNSLRWLRVRLLKDWSAKLKKDGHEERAAAADEDARVLLGDDEYPVPSDRWLQLVSPIGMEVKGEGPKTDSQPADSDEELSEPVEKE